jgi:hypothetical protein
MYMNSYVYQLHIVRGQCDEAFVTKINVEESAPMTKQNTCPAMDM